MVRKILTRAVAGRKKGARSRNKSPKPASNGEETKHPFPMNFTRATLLALACAAAPVAGRADIGLGISIGTPEIVIRSRPPQEMVERVPMSPGPGYFWIRGHWAWRHDNWDWINGRWDRAAQASQEWVPGQWMERNGGWVWREGHYVVLSAPQYPPQGGPVEVMAPEPPPGPIIETVPMAPGPEFFWIGGHWHWNHGWVWAGGHYDRHPHFHEGGGWEAGRWDHRGGNWVWAEGHWR